MTKLAEVLKQRERGQVVLISLTSYHTTSIVAQSRIAHETIG